MPMISSRRARRATARSWANRASSFRVKDAKILVLDEATSSLDSESEHLIQEGLWTLMQGRTVIAIAHRLSTIAGMDRIVYLEAGRIIEEGPHRELLAHGGAYAKLWNRQMGGFIDAA